jgi:hypothetical protein
LAQLEALAKSPESRGAHGEQRVAHFLGQLPDEYCVLHDVRLRAAGFLRFAGKPAQTAQVDHLVVGPTGVFVVETKNWSQESAANGDYFDPYEQVARAGLLCHILLKDARLPTRVHEIIATCAQLKSSRYTGYTKIVRPERVAPFIANRRAELEVDEIAKTVAVLRKLVPGV